SITIAGFGVRRCAEALQADAIPFGRVAHWVLTHVDEKHVLLPLDGADCVSAASHGSLNASLCWPQWPDAAVVIPPDALPEIDLAGLAAASYAPLLAGAANRVLELTLDYANQRTQFGKNIGRFQAIQNQISVMAERTWAAR